MKSDIATIRNLLGPDVLLLPCRKRTKKPTTKWRHLTIADMSDSAHLSRLNRAGNIGVVLGSVSGGLCSIDIDEDNSGKVRVYAKNSEAMERAKQEIDVVTGEIEAGKTYRGIVRGVKDFGVFVECLPGKEGLVHVSEMADFRVNHPEDICKLGDELIVKCIGIDERGRVKLSRRAAMEEQQASQGFKNSPLTSWEAQCAWVPHNL